MRKKKKQQFVFFPENDEIDNLDAKQYHRASFSTRNSALNTSLRKSVRMQDFIQLCDSIIIYTKRAQQTTFLRLERKKNAVMDFVFSYLDR